MNKLKTTSRNFHQASFSFLPLCSLCLFGAILLLAFTIPGCGKRKPPLPPTDRVAQKVEIAGFQRGNRIIISWKMPARNAKVDSVLNIDRADIYRLAEPVNSPLGLTEEEFSSQSNLIATLKITDDDFGLKTLQYTDALQFVGQQVRLRYAIRLANASGQKAGYSNFLMIEPTAKVAAFPSSLTAEPSQDAIKLKWLAPTANIDGSTPASLLGYNIYRSTSEKEPGKLLNKSPVTVANYDDEFFEFGKDYYYFVRAVSIGTQAEPVESSESNVLKFKGVDTFAPSAPTSITLAAGQNMISIFFAVNPEKDVVGYKIYRSTDPDLAKDKWELLTPELLKTNTFQDTKVESGKTYYYYLTATDKAGNVSEMSEVVSDSIR